MLRRVGKGLPLNVSAALRWSDRVLGRLGLRVSIEMWSDPRIWNDEELVRPAVRVVNRRGAR